MRRISDSRTEAAILKKITDEFTKFREVSTGHISKRLRELAISALAEGVKRGRVAQAAGVSPKTISNWSKSARPQAKELSIVSESAARSLPLPASVSAATDSILIRLKSGVEIELAKQELSFEFLSLLSGLGGGLEDFGGTR